MGSSTTMSQSTLSPLSFFKCLADDTRLKSLLLLVTAREACVCDLMAALELDQPKISRHLAELRKCGIVIDERRGRWVYYRIHPDMPDWVLQVLLETGKANAAYVEAALKRLQASIEASACC